MVDSHFNQTMATEEDIPFVSSSSPSKVSFSPCEWVNGLMIVILCSNWRSGEEAEEDQHIHRSSLLLFCLVISPLYCTELREHRLLARQSFATWRREAMDWKCCFWRREGRRGQEHKRNSVGREACEWFHTTYHLPTYLSSLLRWMATACSLISWEKAICGGVCSLPCVFFFWVSHTCKCEVSTTEHL